MLMSAIQKVMGSFLNKYFKQNLKPRTSVMITYTIWSYSGVAKKCIFTEIKMLFLYTISLRPTEFHLLVISF